MRILFILLLSQFIVLNSWSQDCPQINTTFSTQAQIDSFGILYPNCTDLSNINIIISGNDIDNLDAFGSIKHVSAFQITACPLLTSISGFDSLRTVESILSIGVCENLISISGFNNAEELIHLGINGNPLLESFSAFPNINSSVSASFSNNQSLANITGLSKIEFSRQLGIKFENLPSLNSIPRFDSLILSAGPIQILNVGLDSINGFENLLSLPKIAIRFNEKLKAINGFSKLIKVDEVLYLDQNLLLNYIPPFPQLERTGEIAIGANPSLKYLDGFNNLLICGHLNMGVNDSLVTISGFERLEEFNGIGIGFYAMKSLVNIPSFNTVTGKVARIDLDNIGLPSLDFMNNVDTVDILQIFSCDNIATISGFDALKRINDLVIVVNDSLTLIEGFDSITEINNNIIVQQNPILETINGFEKLTNIQSVGAIEENPLLANISAFNNLESSNRFVLNELNIENLDFLNRINVVEELEIKNLPELSNVSGLDSIEIDSLESLVIVNNPKLTSCKTDFLCTFVDLSNTQDISNISNNGSLCSDLITIKNVCKTDICPTEPVVISSQLEADQFLQLYPDCKILEQELLINGIDVSDLSPFDNLEFVNSLTIEGCDSLKQIDNFNNLIHVDGPIYIDNNNELLSIEGFSQIDTSKSVEIRFNDKLETVNGFNTLRTLDFALNIDDNEKLNTIAGFGNLEYASVLFIYRNEQLNSLATFPKLKEVGVLSMSDNNSLLSLNGFNALLTTEFSVDIIRMNSLVEILGFDSLENSEIGIFGNINLKEVDAFHNLQTARSISLRNNPSLESIIAFENLTNLSADINEESFDILDSPILKSIPNFDNVQAVNGEIKIQETGLQSINIFNSISSANNIFIYDNPELIEFEGFNSVLNFDSLAIINNTNLVLCYSEFLCNVSDSPILIAKSNSDANGASCNDFTSIAQGCQPSGNTIDLELSMSQSTPSPEQWSTYSVTATLVNNGDLSATGITVDLLSPDGVVFVGGNEFSASQGSLSIYTDQVWNVGNLAIGESAILTINYFSLVENVTATYVQVLTANELDFDSTPANGTPPYVNEDDEASTDDNPIVVLFPDLTLGALPFTDSLFSGDTFNVQVEIINQGDTVVPSTYSIATYLSTDSDLSSDDFELQTSTSNYLDIGTTTLEIENNILPLNTASGNYFIIVKIDSQDDITESNELNNTLAYNLAITNPDGNGNPVPTGDSLGCNTFYTLVGNILTISGEGLNSPHVIVKVFSPNWSTIFNCVDLCDNPIVFKELTAPGDYHIEISTFDEHWTRTCYLIESVTVEDPLLKEQIQNENLQLYPNPAFDLIHVRFDHKGKNTRLILSNGFGQELQRLNLDLNQQEEYLLDVSELQGGMYWVSMISDSGRIISVPFVKVRD